MEFGFRQCFRSLPPDLAEHHALCETYEFLCIDVLGGQSLNEIIGGLKTGKKDHKRMDKLLKSIKADRSKARDAAFKLLYLILRGEFEDETKDSTKVYNALMFIISHTHTFQSRTRKVVRAAYEERFVVSVKQGADLDKGKRPNAAQLAKEDEDEDDVTTEEEAEEEPIHYSYDYYYDDYTQGES